MSKWKYTPHNKPPKTINGVLFNQVEGHLFLGHDVKGACTITLTPAASMTQPQLNRYGRKIAAAVNRVKPS